jgi:Cof subfamily protein (haloacid dehalogenase superfamily)
MRYKLFAVDVDDTLISDYRPVSAEDIRAVRAASDAGAHVILASGRGYDGVRPYNEALGLTGYSICTGGAQIYDGEGGLVFSNRIESAVVRDVLAWASARGVYAQAYTDDEYLYGEHTEWTDYYLTHCGYPGRLDPSLAKRDDLSAAKIVLFGQPDEVASYAIPFREAFPSLNALTSAPIFLEIFDRRTSKGAALSTVAEKLGIGRKEIASIGDSELDITMFEASGLGCAVPDAAGKVKASADYVCRSESNWVAEVIHRHIL